MHEIENPGAAPTATGVPNGVLAEELCLDITSDSCDARTSCDDNALVVDTKEIAPAAAAVSRDPELVRILVEAHERLRRAADEQARTAIITVTAASIERHGDDGIAFGELSEFAIHELGMATNVVQAAMAKGVCHEQEKKFAEQKKANGHGHLKLVLGPDLAPKASGAAAPDWPEPDLSVLRLNRRAAPKLPLDVFGDRWGRWIENAAQAAASPPDYVTAALLSSASALIGHSRWAQAWEGWTEPPHLWCAAVGDSGDSKSPGLDAVIKHVLPDIEGRMAEGFPDRLKEALSKIEADKAAYEKWKEDVREAVEQGIQPPPAPDMPKDPPAEPRLMLSDATIEKVARLQADEASKGVMMYRDELAGWLIGMKAYNDGARGFWLEGYGGRRWTVDRVKHPQPIVIPRFAVSWIGGIQPSRLAEVMKDADDGLLARYNYFWPEPIPFRRPQKTPDTAWAITALDRLRELELVHDENGFRPFFVHLHHRAADRMEVLGRELQEQKIWTAGLMRSAIGKARGLVLRLSLVLEYLRWCASDSALLPPPEFISEESFDAAARMVTEYMLPMAERTYGDAAASEDDINTATLAAWIVKERPNEPKEVHVSMMVRKVRLPGMKDAKSVHAACKALIEAGWLGQPEKGEYQQRRREAYTISPHLFDALDRCNCCNSGNSINPK